MIYSRLKLSHIDFLPRRYIIFSFNLSICLRGHKSLKSHIIHCRIFIICIGIILRDRGNGDFGVDFYKSINYTTRVRVDFPIFLMRQSVYRISNTAANGIEN